MSRRSAAVLLAVIVLLRFVSMGAPPLFDKTEGRYGEIGREMAVSGDWITPTLHGGEPFWGKPPLHFWATALSFRLFGVNETAARLPGFLAGIGILIITYRLALMLFRDPPAARTAVVLLASSMLHFLLGGQVLLDGTFTLTLTGALASFGRIVAGDRRRSVGLLFFAFLGLALLAKGPIGPVLVFLAVAIHAAWSRSTAAFRGLPLLAGPIVTLLIAAPWYVLAERRTPGFLRYFFVNEHLLRYTKSDYGDLYGHGHVAPYGMIWLLAAAAFLPWTPLLAVRAWGALRTPRRATDRTIDDTECFLWAWALAPLLFFTLSRSLSFPYIFPALPPFALLVVRRFRAPSRAVTLGAGITVALLLAGAVYGAIDFAPPAHDTVLLVAPLLLIALALVVAGRLRNRSTALITAAMVIPAAVTQLSLFWSDEIGAQKSTRILADTVARDWEEGDVLFFDGLPLSAEFYFRGAARDLHGDAAALEEEAAAGWEEKILFVRKGRVEYLSSAGSSFLEREGEVGRYVRYRFRAPVGGAQEE